MNIELYLIILGVTAFEAATLVELKKNGEDWHVIRSAQFYKCFSQFCHLLHQPTIDLILQMTHDNPSDRLVASQVVQRLKCCEMETLKRKIEYEQNNSEMLRRYVWTDTRGLTFLRFTRNFLNAKLFLARNCS